MKVTLKRKCHQETNGSQEDLLRFEKWSHTARSKDFSMQKYFSNLK